MHGCDPVMDGHDPMAGITKIESALEAHADEFLVHRGVELAHHLAEVGDRRFLHPEKDAEPGAEPLHHRLDLPAAQDVVKSAVEAAGGASEAGIECGRSQLLPWRQRS